MNRIALAVLSLILAFVSPPAWADSPPDHQATACPFAEATFADNMASRVLRTEAVDFLSYDTGRYAYDPGTVRISLAEVLLPAWTCATWEGDLVLPDPYRAKSGEALTRTALARDAVAVFEVENDDLHRNDRGRHGNHLVETDGGFFLVRVYNGGDNAINPDRDASNPDVDAAGNWHYRISFSTRQTRR